MVRSSQISMLDWFRDQERRLQHWRDELAAKEKASPEELGWLERHQHWLRKEIERLAKNDAGLAQRRPRPQAAGERIANWLGR